MGRLLHLVQRGWAWAEPQPVTVLLYNSLLLYGFNVAIKGQETIHLLSPITVRCNRLKFFV